MIRCTIALCPSSAPFALHTKGPLLDACILPLIYITHTHQLSSFRFIAPSSSTITHTQLESISTHRSPFIILSLLVSASCSLLVSVSSPPQPVVPLSVRSLPTQPCMPLPLFMFTVAPRHVHNHSLRLVACRHPCPLSHSLGSPCGRSAPCRSRSSLRLWQLLELLNCAPPQSDKWR